MNYKKLNTAVGWGVFALALLVYLLTVAPTASFWDCGEFIAAANELEVTHPPGAPFFLLIGRIFAMLAFNNTANIAFMVNLVSVFASAFTAMFTFWITTYLAKKIVWQWQYDEKTKVTCIMIAGIVAGMTCTFADSIWFNAVEAEVYALSSFFTAIVVWLMLKWEERAEEAHHLKWIILIAYLVGLSTGVHLLNLLTIPALALIYYFKKYDFSWKGLAITLGISVAILAFVQYGMLQYTIILAQKFELFFTGAMTREGVDKGGMGYTMGTGSLVLGFLLITTSIILLIYSHLKQKHLLNTIVLCYVVLMMGFSSYLIIFIRSGANPPLDMNNPENVMTFLSYMRREQYGDRPLLYGTRYNVPPIYDKEGYPVFEDEFMRYTILEGKNKYIEDEMAQDYAYPDDKKSLFPRMYSIDPAHYNYSGYAYKFYVADKGATDNPKDDNPTVFDELHFFFDYQLRQMYIRYLMWNFVGRKSDIQDAGWEFWLGDSNNKGNNRYWFIPFLLGAMGFIWQFTHSRKQAVVTLTLFFFTGVAIILYLNQTPLQPRERDYAYAGSFQTFAIWVGMGSLFLVEILGRYLKNKTIAASLAMAAPFIMCIENWDDHTRKGRWIDIDYAYNLLNSCKKDAILFTGGDNDTFGLWYLQEVEKVREDVRVVNLELLISDWNIDQIKRKENQSEAFELDMQKNDYAGEKYSFYPYDISQPVVIPVNKTNLIANGTISSKELPNVVDTFVWQVKGRGGNMIYRKDSAAINLIRNIAQKDWKRPVYFANTMGSSAYMGLQNYLQLEGLAYRLLPIPKSENTPNDISFGRVELETMYHNLMEVFRFRGLDDGRVNLDEHIRATIINSYRKSFYRLGNAYAEQIEKWTLPIVRVDTIEGKPVKTEIPAIGGHEQEIRDYTQKIKNLMAYCKKKMPYEVTQPDLSQLILNAELYKRANLTEEANQEYEIVAVLSAEKLAYYARLMEEYPSLTESYRDEFQLTYHGLLSSIKYYSSTHQTQKAKVIAQKIKELLGTDDGFKLMEKN